MNAKPVNLCGEGGSGDDLRREDASSARLPESLGVRGEARDGEREEA